METTSRKLAPCGTRSAYNRHLRYSEPTCEPCRQALRIHVKRMRLLHLEKVKARKKKYVQENRQKVNEYFRNRHNNIPEEIRCAKKRAYYQKTKERYKEVNRQSQRKRAALKKQNKTSFYTEKQVLELYGDICYLCNKKINLQNARKVGFSGWQTGLHIDHLIPISKNGSDTLDNVRPTHGLCNVRKNNKDFEYAIAN